MMMMTCDHWIINNDMFMLLCMCYYTKQDSQYRKHWLKYVRVGKIRPNDLALLSQVCCYNFNIFKSATPKIFCTTIGWYTQEIPPNVSMQTFGGISCVLAIKRTPIEYDHMWIKSNHILKYSMLISEKSDHYRWLSTLLVKCLKTITTVCETVT